jgi:hypothetical protein
LWELGCGPKEKTDTTISAKADAASEWARRELTGVSVKAPYEFKLRGDADDVSTEYLLSVRPAPEQPDVEIAVRAMRRKGEAATKCARRPGVKANEFA